MTKPSTVHVDATAGALVIEKLVVDDPRVLGECRHWSEGQRGAPVELAALAGAELTSFAVQALTIGSCAMSAAAGVQERYGIEALTAGLATARATDALAARTPLKGATYEDQVHALMADIAAGLGDEYVQTSNVVGLRTRNKKGDGVLTAAESDSRVVVEMTDSPRGSWSAYLQEAEANRGAQASLGLVRHDHQLPGGPMLTFGPRRIVMVFDPETDSLHLLRCVVQVLRLAAVSATVRVESGEVASAAERLAEALTSLERIAKIRKSAGQVQRTALSIDAEAEALESTLTRLLTQAHTALASVLRGPHDDVA